MWMVSLAVLFCGGVLGAASLIVAKKPDAKELINKLVPYQGWIGCVMFIWGIWDTITCIRIISLISLFPVTWIIFLVGSLTELLLGFLLGYGLITKYALSKSPEAMKKGDEVRAKLAKFQGPLGIISIIVSILWLLVGLGILAF